VACQSCRQMAGLPNGISLASPLRRLGGYLMDGVLFVVTLGVGYLVWWVIALGRAQTPGKQVLGMKVLRLETIEPAGWGLMLLREVVAKGLTGRRPHVSRPARRALVLQRRKAPMEGALMSDSIACPECGAPARVTARFRLHSTAGPVEHLKTGCVNNHWLTPLAETVEREQAAASDRDLAAARS
jgi:RDD family